MYIKTQEKNQNDMLITAHDTLATANSHHPHGGYPNPQKDPNLDPYSDQTRLPDPALGHYSNN